MAKYKRGRLSQQEREFILMNKDEMSTVEIARKVKRTPDYIRKIIKDFSKKTGEKTTPDAKLQEEEFKILMNLRVSPTYEMMEKQFTVDELRFIEHEYLRLIKQFAGDVMATEVTQMLQAVRIQVLMDRNMEERQAARTDITGMALQQRELAKQIRAMGGQATDADKEELMRLEDEIASRRSAEHACTKEYLSCQQEFNKLMQTLKATRDQRLDKANSSSFNYVELLKEFMRKDVQEREGRTLELSKLARVNEGISLGRPHKFEDEHMDNPLLTHETVHLEPLPESE